MSSCGDHGSHGDENRVLIRITPPPEQARTTIFGDIAGEVGDSAAARYIRPQSRPAYRAIR